MAPGTVRKGAELLWIARDSGIRGSADVRRILDEAGGLMLRVDASELGQWGSALIAFQVPDIKASYASLATRMGEA